MSEHPAGQTSSERRPGHESPDSNALTSQLISLHALASDLLKAKNSADVDVMIRRLAKAIAGAVDARLAPDSDAHTAVEGVPAPLEDSLFWLPIDCVDGHHGVLVVGFARPTTLAPGEIELFRLAATMAGHSLDRLAWIEDERGRGERSEVLQHLALRCACSRIPGDVARTLIDVLIGAGVASVEVSVTGHHARAVGRHGVGQHRHRLVDLRLHADVEDGLVPGTGPDQTGRLCVTVVGGSPFDPRHDAFWRAVVRITGEALARVRRVTELEDLARNDPLTGLSNRRGFDEFLRRGLARLQRADDLLAVIYVDLDRFKEVNDWFGHRVGDELLVRVGAALREVLRPSDIAARLGGDEFAVLAESIGSEAAAQALAERIRTSIARNVGSAIGHEVTASVGYALTQCADEDADEFLTRADWAMYNNKRTASASVHPARVHPARVHPDSVCRIS